MRRAVAAPLADLRDAPGGALMRQYAAGSDVRVIEESGGAARVRTQRDGLEGWMAAEALGPPVAATHRVRTLSAHLYPAPDIKAQPLARLPFGARVAAEGAEDALAGGGGSARFLRTGAAWMPAAQVSPVGRPDPDPVAVAETFLGVPYLWGGDGPDGIDCSGLVQAALLACGIACPADSGPQRAAFGGAAPGAPARAPRGTLIFWAGHVAICRGDGTLIHANAGAMAVAVEGIEDAIARIAAGGDGPPLAMGRPGG